MKITNTILALLMSFTLCNAEDKGGKFLVVDNTTYSKINQLNILDGGIKKTALISSINIKDKDLLKFYPEYLLYDGVGCTIIENVFTNDSKIIKNMILLEDKKEILKVVKKIKLLQLLNDYIDSDVKITNVSKELIQSVGVICDQKLLLRGKYYGVGDTIGTLKIKSIDVQNSTLTIKE